MAMWTKASALDTVVDRLPWELLRELPPLAACLGETAEGIEAAAAIGAGPAALGCYAQEGLNLGPRILGEAARENGVFSSPELRCS